MFDIAFWKEFFDALYPDYYYRNIKSPLILVDLNFILIGLYIGIVAASAFICYRKNHLGIAVRALLKVNAHSAEDAKTPEELGIANRPTLVRALRRCKFGSIVKLTGVDLEAKRPDYTNERYYIPEDKRYQAEDRYSRKGMGVGVVIFWAIILIPVFMLLRFVIPELLQLLDNFITGLKS
ncbi:MAG: hypothetical protein E7578_01070 [Ruminococcaceae bacterium]|nr:hypothetical protein [Oscillospiraceae bacterium]